MADAPPAHPTPRSELLGGARGVLPILAGAVPFGLIYGALAVQAGLSVPLAVAMSSIVFAGSAQFAATQLFAAGAPGLVIVGTVFTINVRHVLYSASIAPYLRGLGRRWTWLLAYLLTDEAYAVAITHFQRPGDRTNRHWYLLGAGLALWAEWQVSSAAGALLGTHLGDAFGLSFVVPVTFIALVVPALHDRPTVAAALTGGVVAVAAGGLPYGLGLILGAVAGIAVGALLDARETPKAGSDEPGEPWATG
jgi:4-azaleucine resistance transporter AzlC